MAKQKLEHTYSSYVRIRDVTLKTCQKRWMIGRSGERGSGISVLVAWHDDDDDDDIFQNKVKEQIMESFNFEEKTMEYITRITPYQEKWI